MKLLLWFVNWIYKDGAIACLCKDIAKDSFGKSVYFALRYEKIEPWMWNFPQAFWS